MAEPQVQYAKTSDGVSIAYWTMGKGDPLVQMPRLPYSHIQMEWQIPDFRGWYERVAAKRMIVRYDPRGTGLSDRDATDSSLDAQVMDLGAVVDRHGLDKFALFGIATSGPAAISYATRQPERLSHLLLWCAYARASDFFDSPRVQGMLALMNKDWELLTESAAQFAYGWSGADSAHRYAAYLRECVTQSAAWEAYHALAQVDVTDLLPQVQSSTLVIHLRRISHPSLEAARAIASHIPDARLAVLEGELLAPWMGDIEPLLRAIDEFLGGGEEAATKPELPEGMAVILFADIVESTALTEELGDAAFRGKARELDTVLRRVISEAGGTPVEGKLLGDGVLAVFTSARQAIEAALRCGTAGDEAGLTLHLGLHAGDVIREGNNVYGGAVNIAARIAGASAPGEVLVSDTVRGLARTSAGVSFDDRGEHSLKGVAEAQRLFAVRKGG